MGTFTAFLNNAALMLILCVIYDIFNIYAIPKKSLRDGLTGVLVGLICIAVMLNPWSLEKGLYFDTRWVLLSLCGLYFGLVPTMLAVVIAGAFRLYQGGPGVIVGTVVIVVTACVGLAWKYWQDTRDKPLNCIHLYLFGIVVQLAMLSCIFLFPADLRNTILKHTALPILLIYPVLTTIIGLILKKQEDRRIADNERFYSISLATAALESTPDGILIVNMEGKITRWNQKFVDLWNVPQHLLDTTVKNPVLTYAVSQMVDPKKFLSEAKELHENPDKTSADTLNLADGRIFNFYSQPQKIGSEIVGRFWAFRDITEGKQFEDALARSERFLKTVIDTEPDCIKMLDSDCNLLMMNPAGLKMIQADSFEQVKGQCVCPLITSAYRDAFASLTKQVFLGHAGVLEFETIGLKGRHIWLETHAVPFRDDHDEIVSLLGITRDVTERKEANEKIKNLNEHLEKMVEDRTQDLAHANRDLNSLCYTISHELMAPVTRLKSFGQVLQEQLRGNPGEALYCAERITVASDKLQQVIDAVLQLARLSQAPFDPVPQNLSNIARVIIDELVKGIPGRHVEVTIADEITATCDPQMVRTCLANLFENALKFSVRQSTAEIEFGYDTTHGALFVSDNGVGFDMSHAERLFEPFVRMHREDEFAGSGIGLATVRRIVERHGGRIWAEAGQGKGATFYFTLARG